MVLYTRVVALEKEGERKLTKWLDMGCDKKRKTKTKNEAKVFS